jgi:hypothetical protein
MFLSAGHQKLIYALLLRTYYYLNFIFKFFIKSKFIDDCSLITFLDIKFINPISDPTGSEALCR